LLEVSAVSIPANPNALALGLKSGAVQKADLQDTLDLLRAITHSSSTPPQLAPVHLTAPTNPMITPEHLLTFMYKLRDLLRHT